VQNNPSNTGNSDLTPETINSYELSFQYEPITQLVTKLSFFYYEIDDLIDKVVVGNTKQWDNTKNQDGYGFELEADWQVSDTLRLRGNLARQRSKDRASDEITVGAPGWQFYANANWQFKRDWSLDGQYFWIGDRHRAAGDSRSDIDDYDVVNLTLRRKNIAKRWDAALAVRNLFDEDVREPSSATSNITNDYPMDSRAIWAEMRLHF
jgi:iron complex outermembrane receptor protein